MFLTQLSATKKSLFLLALVLIPVGAFFIFQDQELPSWFPFQEKVPHQQIDLLFTVDVETPSPVDQWHPYDDKALFITGDGTSHTPSLGYIMSSLEKYHFKGNFFLDVYEYKLFKKPDTLKNIAQEIDARGHEVELHCHASHLIPGKELTDFSPGEQRELLSLGKGLIENWTGKTPTAFRAGAYLMDDNTFSALHDVGIPIDSSVFYLNPQNRFKSFTQNQAGLHRSIIELPITTGHRANRKGMTKFDLNWLGYKGFKQVIAQAKQSRQKQLVFMMHSFSLLRFDRNKPYKPLEANNVKVEELKKILAYIAHDPDIHVITFKDWYQRNKRANLSHYEPEFSPLIK